MKRKVWSAAGRTVAELASIGRNSEDPTQLIAIFDYTTDPRVWRALAGNLNLPAPLFTSLADVADQRTQENIAVHPSAPLRVLGRLAKRSDRSARLVAYNPASSPALLKRLAAHSNPSVRAGAAWNWKTPQDALEALAADENEKVIERVWKNGNLPVTGKLVLARSGALEICLGLAGNYFTEEEVLAVLASHPEPEVRVKVSWNKNTPDGLRLRLAADPVESVREAVACNWDSPEDALAILFTDPSPKVRGLAARNPSAPIH